MTSQNPPPDEEEDDYMTMTFDDAPASSITRGPSAVNPTARLETSLQRRLRLQREAEARARPRSKAELAAEADAHREARHATSLLADPAAAKKSKGLVMMAKMGFKVGEALGKRKERGEEGEKGEKDRGRGGNAEDRSAHSTDDRGGEAGGREGEGEGGGGGEEEAEARLKEPLRINIRDGREGIGLEAERQRRFRETAEAASQQAKRARVDETTYRDRMRLERETARLGRLTEAAQKVAERMDEAEKQESLHASAGESDAGARGRTAPRAKTRTSSRPLKALPVEFRGLVRARERTEQERRMRHDLESSVTSSLLPPALPAYNDDDELDRHDRIALGRDEGELGVPGADEELDESDAELDEFESLGPAEKLQRVVRYLRAWHRYCFWCKAGYPDEAMEGCPGETEEDHD